MIPILCCKMACVFKLVLVPMLIVDTKIQKHRQFAQNLFLCNLVINMFPVVRPPVKLGTIRAADQNFIWIEKSVGKDALSVMKMRDGVGTM
eukprot:CAMPEP_0171310182 /NCGR_PEP_ID=MMETSP0816-20121228/20415_1 /TAXON_ID=420281 /ORGANISM="Proboscia inermis, Strain CCAP1064/1" /LENGTH=90 /DNA_ID=CAMNT_0011794199 /DNA_START=221 /DNA_END=493 /DNA_ORIENTATION=+